MTTKTTENIQNQLHEILSKLPLSGQEQVLKFAISLQKKQLFQDWDAISDREAAALKAEFAEEDLAFSEASLTDYLHLLDREDLD
ncbi:hypothetical protein [Aerosakkonema funiforme]|uniref:Programmed cell death antitoxin YdcD n=1 Tax=Aerosakkonema funiforme FACHB-1375 TaxID=2949571 RepID=A0A926VNJ0_9CYAN|nr:hypothetical protein [Aerosakkonema funiforme]MBD2186117.1 hypothetical protein [Aerosakkonema funiforme FACHB-1375]